MALPAEKRKLTAAEYLAIEEKAEFKSEFYDGEMFPLGGAPHAMAGGRPEHSLVAANLGGTLWARLGGGPCRVYNSDLRVHIALTGVYTYPDLTVVCGESRFIEPQGGLVAVVNPTVLVEVLSPTTADADRGEKFMQYQQIETLREYVLVAIDQPRVEHFATAGLEPVAVYGERRTGGGRPVPGARPHRGAAGGNLPRGRIPAGNRPPARAVAGKRFRSGVESLSLVGVSHADQWRRMARETRERTRKRRGVGGLLLSSPFRVFSRVSRASPIFASHLSDLEAPWTRLPSGMEITRVTPR